MSGIGKTILVTGAAGFIGAFVAARLADMGHHVIGCDNFNDYYLPQLKHDRVAALLTPRGVYCHQLEIANAGQLEALFVEYQPALVVHLAAQAGVRYSLKNPDAYVQSNLVGFGNMLESCRRHGIKHLLYASSSSVYGANEKIPFSEQDRTDEPQSLYAATKKSNELMAYSYSCLFGIPATGLRFFTVYGPWGRPDMAYFSFTQKILSEEKIPVFAGGKLCRDYTYIDDIVEGVVRLAFKPMVANPGKPPHAVFNIGNNHPVCMMDFIHMLEKALGVKAKIDFQPMQAGDVPTTYANTEALRKYVGFSPDTPLELGLPRFVEWYRNWART